MEQLHLEGQTIGAEHRVIGPETHVSELVVGQFAKRRRQVLLSRFDELSLGELCGDRTNSIESARGLAVTGVRCWSEDARENGEGDTDPIATACRAG